MAGGGSAGAANLPVLWLSESVTKRCALRSGRVGSERLRLLVSLKSNVTASESLTQRTVTSRRPLGTSEMSSVRTCTFCTF